MCRHTKNCAATALWILFGFVSLKSNERVWLLHVLPFFLLAPIFPRVTFCETELNAEMWS